MDYSTALTAAREALARDSYGISPEEGADSTRSDRASRIEIGPDFRLDQVDDVTRWVIAVALEAASDRKIKDHIVCEASTLAELIAEVVDPGLEVSESGRDSLTPQP